MRHVGRLLHNHQRVGIFIYRGLHRVVAIGAVPRLNWPDVALGHERVSEIRHELHRHRMGTETDRGENARLGGNRESITETQIQAHFLGKQRSGRGQRPHGKQLLRGDGARVGGSRREGRASGIIRRVMSEQWGQEKQATET